MWDSCHTWRLFPGLYCPGLIEAPTSKHLTQLTRCFRGSIAPASLKPFALDRDEVLRRRGFRGSIAPASLKHAALRHHHCHERLRFRGSIAPASLKLETRLDRVHQRLGFRGSIAPASLKPHGHSPLQSNDALGFRGSIAPASLKRLPQGASRIRTSDVSGALLPRPH